MGSYTAGRFFEFLKWALCPFFMYRDVLYAVGAWMRRNGDVLSGFLLLANPKYLHPCRQCRGRMDAQERRCTRMYCQDFCSWQILSTCIRAGNVTSAGRTGRLQGGRWYDYMDVGGRVTSGTVTGKTYGTGFRETIYTEVARV